MTMQYSYTVDPRVAGYWGTQEEKKNWVRGHIGLVKYVVRRFGFQHARNEHVLEETDLVQFGLLGLLDAADRFEPGKGVKFETYAVTRIKGTILDELRKLDWVPRSVRKKKELAERVLEEMENGANRASTAVDIAARLSMTLEEYRDLISDARRLAMDGRLGYEEETELLENVAADQASDPFEIVNAEETRARLIEAVESLRQRDRLVITLYYYEGMTFREIGQVLKISESRVCQIQKTILSALRTMLS